MYLSDCLCKETFFIPLCGKLIVDVDICFENTIVKARIGDENIFLWVDMSNGHFSSCFVF